MTTTTTIRVRIPGLAMDEANDSEMTLNPERSGYMPTLGHKLKAAPSRRQGKGVSYVLDLTPAEAGEFAEFCEDRANAAAQGELHSTARACLVTAERIYAALEREAERNP